MHQNPRPSPNPNRNPERTNNPRDPRLARSRSSMDLPSYTEKAATDATAAPGRSDAASGSAGQDREVTKLNQIIQHFHTKAALLICSSRANLPKSQNPLGDIRQNRWFNIVVDETDVLIDHLQEWRRPDLADDHPRPLVIEIFLDNAHLTNNQVLVITDEEGRRYDVAAALPPAQHASTQSAKNGGRHCEVVLERWTLELGKASHAYPRAEFNEKLPDVYKKGVVLFRSLYTFLRLVPAFKLYRKLLRPTAGSHSALKLKFRIRKGRPFPQDQFDPLSTPLCPSDRSAADSVEHHAFQPLLTPVGPLCCSLDYRTNCAFGIADAEALISDHFHGLDERIPAPAVGRSLPDDHVERRREQYSSTAAPTTTAGRERPRAMFGAYGSLGTFHDPHRRRSPVSELRQRALEDDEDDMNQAEDIRAAEGASHRRSVDYIANPPFKAGSLTSSPRPPSSPSTSIGRTESNFGRYAGGTTTASSSKRTSLNALPQQQLRTPSVVSEVAVASYGSSSPKPAPVRYSSSFANRPRRFTSQSSKAAESNASSGRGSSDSKEKSDHLNEGGSTGSAKTDDDDIASFISALEKSKDIKFHTPPSAARDNNSNVQIVNLAKYSSMRDPSTQLAEEMSSSSLIQTSSTPPSRRLSNVPGLSTSSSPSRVVTHAPYVRSRLSTHSVAEEASAASAASGEGSGSNPRIRQVEEEDDEEEPFIFPHHGNTLD